MSGASLTSGFDRNVAKYVKELLQTGNWSARRTRNGHIALVHIPSENTASIGPHGDDLNRAFVNAKSLIRRIEREYEMRETVTAPIDLQGWDDQVASTIVGAIACGWSARELTNGNVSLTIGKHRLRLAKKDRPTRANLNQWRRMITAHGDPAAMAALEQTENEDEWIALIMDRVNDTLDTAVVRALPREAVEVFDRRIISERPWMARRGPAKDGGKTYESAAVTQRSWSDGTVDYACSHEGCDFVSEVARSVSSHYGGSHTRHGEGVPVEEAQKVLLVDPTYTEPLSHRPYQPSSRVASALAEWLSAQSWDSTDGLAELVLTWVHERPDLPEPEPKEPLNDTQILDRVRRLVDSGATSRAEEQVEALRSELAYMHAANAEMQDRLAEVEQERDSVKGSLTALAEMATSVL